MLYIDDKKHIYTLQVNDDSSCTVLVLWSKAGTRLCPLHDRTLCDKMSAIVAIMSLCGDDTDGLLDMDFSHALSYARSMGYDIVIKGSYE